MTELQSPADVDALLRASHESPVFVLKHSNSCPISMHGRMKYATLDSADGPPLYLLVVQHAREASNHLASALGVRHETPQALLLSNGEAVGVWNHSAIRTAALQEAAAALDEPQQ